jgi:hypothetical protein
VDLGLRDYSRWLNNVLPGKVGGSDIDLALHQESSDRVLFVEYKEPNKRLSVGQRLLLRAMKKRGIEVWVAWGPYKDGTYKAGPMDDAGETPFLQVLSEAELGAKVRQWWYSGMSPQP